MKNHKVSVTLAALLMLFALRPAMAQSGCDLAFLRGPAPTMDGALSASEWTAASLPQSGVGVFVWLRGTTTLLSPVAGGWISPGA